jgi:adenosylcobinamide kinase/adenosylcobinamide-phosphate guanylyltransferase
MLILEVGRADGKLVSFQDYPDDMRVLTEARISNTLSASQKIFQGKRMTETFRLAFICGGAKSGKSRFAQKLAESLPAPRLYVATGEALDEEMAARIARHQQDRGPEWQTREEPLALARVLRQSDSRYGVILVDCLTMWLSNLLTRQEAELDREKQALHEVVQAMKTPVIMVSNEVGWGIVPANELARRFRDAAGLLHQEIAALADAAALVVSGLPLYLKGEHLLKFRKD